jgi:cysteine desulfurase family protein
MSDMIYLDNAATTFPKPECVYNRVDYVQRNLGGNAGRGTYNMSRTASEIIDNVRTQLAKMVKIENPSNVVLTPSATIALNEIIFGLEWNEFKTIYISPFEHNAVVRPLNMIAKKYGFKILKIPFIKETMELDSDEMNLMFASNPPDYVFLNHISNVVGLIIPVEQIADAAKEYKSVVILDASQSLGLLEIGANTKFDFIVFAGHKNLYSPFGVGGFIQNTEVRLNPVFAGGTGSDSLNTNMPLNSPDAYEFASPNILAIAGLNESIMWLESIGYQNIYQHKKELSINLVEGLRGSRNVQIYVPEDLDNHIGVVSFNIKGYSSNDVGMILDQDFNIAVRAGYHCAPFIHEFLGTVESYGTIRASLGYFNTQSDIDRLLDAISQI